MDAREGLHLLHPFLIDRFSHVLLLNRELHFVDRVARVYVLRTLEMHLARRTSEPVPIIFHRAVQAINPPGSVRTLTSSLPGRDARNGMASSTSAYIPSSCNSYLEYRRSRCGCVCWTPC